jgi:tRNA U55 pseudouridine synthase TruB
MSLIDRVVAAIFGGPSDKPDAADRQLIDELVEGIVDAVEPRVRLRSGYRDKLADGVARTIAHLRELGRLPLDPIVLSRAAWATDSYVRSFFGNAADVAGCIARSQELRRFFDAHPECREASALLGMKRVERKVLAPRMEGGVMRQDVAQTTVSFSDHRLIAAAADAAQTRLDVGHRIVRRLAQLVLARIVAVDARAKDLNLHHAYLVMKRRMLEHASGGMEALVTDPGSIDVELADVERALKDTTEDYREAKASLATMDGYIGHINAVLANPEQQVTMERVHLRVTLMGVKVDAPASDEPVQELDLTELGIGEGLRVTIALVRIPREEMTSREDLLAQAERFL